MRVLIVSDCYAPRLGGIETQVRDLARNLLRHGHEPAVVTATPAGTHRGREVERADGFPVFRTTVPLPAELPVHPRARGEMTWLMEHLQPDVVHVHVGVVSPFAWPGIAAARRCGVPTAITFHCVLGGWSRAVGRLGGLSPVRLWQEAGADLTAVSSMLAQQVLQAGAREPVTVLPNGISLADWHPGPSGEGRPPGAPLRVVASLRWIGRKRPLQVVQAFAEAVRRSGCRDAVLDVYGDGPLRHRLEQEVVDSGMAERITLVGRVDRPELARAFAQADVYLQTSPADSFGISVLEARTAGLAVVALGSSGVGDFIEHGVDGLLADDDAGLAEALAGLLADPQRLERIKHHNRTVPPTPEWGSVTGMNLSAYRRAGARG
ncbi:glycosyltransferase family 1 protein [Actinomyces sp. 2119]|uniref:Glycosyltransferase family 1 protein n=1 Tax=Actinomyces lilanjuaniae TaxID=2321394 RepID=A0ABM6Z6R1_9ACTO|nr:MULTISPECIES: glycosyltransferase family 4 protein [Actinomyces]AYD90908.1 glycosyltransferase family 1 protein [Actinomyces lilanjuaniae]RJF42532.1 glycosyltransferase family 1 protein [Actinomyces sp. 2119]